MRAHIHLRTNYVICLRSVPFLKVKKVTTKTARHTVWLSIQLWPTVQWTEAESIKTPKVRGVPLIWPCSDLSRMTEGVATDGLRRGVTSFLCRRRRGHQSCLARKEPIPQWTAPAAPSLHPASATIPKPIKMRGEALKSVLLKAQQR